MRAIELRIVFEDDDGGTYVRTIVGEDAEDLWKVLHCVSELVDQRQDRMDKDFPEAKIVGPVLRKVTEICGQHNQAVVCGNCDTGGRAISIANLIPAEIQGQTGLWGRESDFRFDVTAVRVPDPERDARELCGLPEKKP